MASERRFHLPGAMLLPGLYKWILRKNPLTSSLVSMTKIVGGMEWEMLLKIRK